MEQRESCPHVCGLRGIRGKKKMSFNAKNAKDTAVTDGGEAERWGWQKNEGWKREG
jgi:hypothetical protein